MLLAAALVTIRIYNYAAIPPAQMAAARATAERIFDKAGISLNWIDCRVPGDAAGASCTEPLDLSGEFVLRLREPSAPTGERHIALGSSQLDRHAGGGVLMTIDPGLVSQVAGQAGADPSLVLGRAIAHEVGHLLIGTPEHARAGLMRALWSQRELRLNRPADWHFSPGEGAFMRQSLLGTRRAN